MPEISTPGVSGAVVAIRSITKTDTFSGTSTSWADVTGLSIDYTPTSASNKILVIANVYVGYNPATNSTLTRIVRDATPVGVGDTSGSRQSGGGYGFDTVGQSIDLAAMVFDDTPATASQVTYKVQIIVSGASGNAYVNRSHLDENGVGGPRVSSSLTIIEHT